MAESSSPALPGDVEWLPGPGGTWVLRIHPATPEAPALILRVLGGGERRIEAGPSAVTEYAIPAELDWSAAWLQWPDGTRAALPLPHGPHAEVIELRPRRFARNEPPVEAGWRGEIAPPVREALEAASRLELGDESSSPGEDPRAADSARGGLEPEGEASHAAGLEPGGYAQGAAGTVAGDHPAPGAAVAGGHGTPGAGGAVPGDDEAPGGAVAGGHGTPGAGGAVPGDDEAPGAAASLETGAVGHSWTTPPQQSDSTREPEDVWRERRDDLRRELSEAADAIARARDGERSARDAVVTALAAARADLRASRAAREADASALTALTGELGAERAAHAVTRGSVGTLADALSAARAELAAAKTRGEATRADLEVARAELVAARATGAAELAEARSDASQARAEAASLRDALALRDRPLAGRGDLGRLAREQAEAAAIARRSPAVSADLLANLDAAAAALRAAVPAAADGMIAGGPGADLAGPRGDETAVPASSVPANLAGTEFSGGAETVPSESPASEPPVGAGVSEAAASEPPVGAGPDAVTASSPGDATDLVTPASSALVAAGADLRLRRALIALAREDAVAAGALLVGLLPAQGSVIEETLTYDLTVRGVGTFAVFVADGSAHIVRLSRRRPRAQALFHLSAEPYVLAELLAGERDKVGRFRRKARLSGRRKRAKELLPLTGAKVSLADAVKAGARLEPGLVYRILPLAVDPEWTRGHTFTVAQQIAELAPHAWHVSARDGQPLHVVQRHADVRADATVTMSQAAFERMLRDEPPATGDRPQIRGDREAVAALKRWTDRARGV